MARATRSTAILDPPQPPSPPKKRKRHSSPTEGVPFKHARVHSEPPSPSSVAAVPLTAADAQAILDVLEMTDTQGLLDRVFPLQHSPDSRSLRALLSAPADHPLRVLRAAVHHLLPLAAHPRARPSATAAQQLRFCNLALDLLDQASRNALPLPLHPVIPQDDPAASPKSPSRSPVLSPRRYALVQHLASTDYWSSLNADTTTNDLKHIPTAHADLVAILPSAPSVSSKPLPTLASYHPRQQGPKKILPAQRRVLVAKFLDYGPWASFAPAFDHDMEHVGRRELGDVLFQRNQRIRESEHTWREAIEGRGSIVEEPDLEHKGKQPIDVEAELDGLLLEEEVKAIKAALGNLELENAVQDLLEKNSRALDRLEELQIQRLTKEGGGSSVAEEDSEEWDTAQSIMDSLTVLSSLRPRTASDDAQQSLVPPPSVLRKLHRTLALEPTPGWYGTLPVTHATALRDDSTVKVRAGAPVPTTAAPAPAPAPIAPAPAAPVAAIAAPPYAAYTYTYATGQQQPATAQQPYRPQSATPYAPYKPGQTTPYYQNYPPPAPQHQASYYGQQTYGAAAAAGAQPYATTNQQPYAAYTNWYSQYPAQIPTTGTPSGSGTPQPLVTTPATYGTFFNAAAGTATPPPAAAATRTPAVANTVMANKTVAPQPVAAAPTSATWSYAQPAQQQGAVPTLPAHLRSAQPVAGAAQTYQQATPAMSPFPAQHQPSPYYGQYQSQPPSAPATPAAR